MWGYSSIFLLEYTSNLNRVVQNLAKIIWHKSTETMYNHTLDLNATNIELIISGLECLKYHKVEILIDMFGYRVNMLL